MPHVSKDHLANLDLLLFLAYSATSLAQAPELSPSVREFVSVDAPVVALRHVRVIDGTGAPAIEDQTIVIVDGKIREMGPAATTPVPENAELLDLNGHTVIPGIVGMHEHLFYPAGSTPALYPTLGVTFPRMYLANGVTTMRTGGSMEPYLDQNIKRRIDSGRMVGPKMHLTAPYLEGQGSPILQLHQLDGPEEARQMVNYWADLGFTSFKAYNYISRDELRAAVDEAHKRGLKVTGHLCSIGFGEAAEIGIDNLEHGWGTNTEFAPGKQPDQCPPRGQNRQALASLEIESPEAQETIRNLVQHGVAITSTLVVNEASMPGRPMMPRRALDTMSAEAQANFFSRRARAALNFNALSVVLFRKEMEFQYAFAQAGGLLVAGVDPTVMVVPYPDLETFGTSSSWWKPASLPKKRSRSRLPTGAASGRIRSNRYPRSRYAGRSRRHPWQPGRRCVRHLECRNGIQRWRRLRFGEVDRFSEGCSRQVLIWFLFL